MVVAKKLFRQGSRTGLTVIEVLVVAAIVMALLGLGVTALQQVRAAARRTGCADNLRQIGVALHAYHGTHGAFPPGVDFQGGKSPTLLLGWAARLLPYIDQEQLWKATEQAYREVKSFDRNPPHVGLNTVIALYACPDD